MSHEPDSSQLATSEDRILHDLETTLREEREAINDLDYAGIDTARTTKEGIDEALKNLSSNREHNTVHNRDELRSRYAFLLGYAEENNLRLSICLRTIKGLISTLTGTKDRGYGPTSNRSRQSVPVLTSSFG